MSIIFSKLLPYSLGKKLRSVDEIKRILQVLIFYCRVSREAIHYFLDGQFEQFDAQISENLCQIRAYQLIMLTKQSFNTATRDMLFELSETLKQGQLNCSKLLVAYLNYSHSSNYRNKIKKK